MSTKLIAGYHQWRALPRCFVIIALLSLAFAAVSFVVLAFVAHSSTHSSLLQSEPTLLVVGVVNAVVGSLQTACGYCTQRLGHQFDQLTLSNRDIRASTSPQTLKKMPLVAIGIVLLACGSVSAVVNLSLLGQSVTAPFAALTLIFNGALACTILKERVTKFDVVATVLVVLGVSISTLGVGMTSIQLQSVDLKRLQKLFLRSYFPAIYLVALLSLAIVSFGYVTFHRLQRSRLGLCCYSIGAGVMSGFSSLCVKCAVEVLKSCTRESSCERNLERPVVWLLIAGAIVCVVFQLKLMSTGLKFFGTLKFVPPYHVFIIISNLLNGFVYFNEASSYNLNSAALFGLGCGLATSGVLLLLGKAPHANGGDISAKPNHEDQGFVLPRLEISGMLPIHRASAPDLSLSDSDSVEV